MSGADGSACRAATAYEHIFPGHEHVEVPVGKLVIALIAWFAIFFLLPLLDGGCMRSFVAFLHLWRPLPFHRSLRFRLGRHLGQALRGPVPVILSPNGPVGIT